MPFANAVLRGFDKQFVAIFHCYSLDLAILVYSHMQVNYSLYPSFFCFRRIHRRDWVKNLGLGGGS